MVCAYLQYPMQQSDLDLQSVQEHPSKRDTTKPTGRHAHQTVTQISLDINPVSSEPLPLASGCQFFYRYFNGRLPVEHF